MLYRIEFYVPDTHLDAVKQALFSVGAGKVGNYDCCAWQTRGSGQYRPLAGSEPFLGESHKLETIREFKVEMVCEQTLLAKAILALKQCHPYEEVAFAVIAIDPPQF